MGIKQVYADLGKLFDNLRDYPALMVPINTRFHLLPEATQNEILAIVRQPMDDQAAARALELLNDDRAVFSAG